MSFAGFNSSKFVKGRLQAALYAMRKRNRDRREGDPTPQPVEIFFGAQTTGGGGTWGAGTDRAMFRQLTLTSPNGTPITVKAVHIAIRTAGAAGENFKGLVYTDLGTPDGVGSQLAVGAVQSAESVGYQRSAVTEFQVPSGTVVWAGGVWSDGAFQAEFDSETVQAAPNTVMFASSFDYTNPPADAPAVVDGSYANTLACYLECTYIPD